MKTWFLQVKEDVKVMMATSHRIIPNVECHYHPTIKILRSRIFSVIFTTLQFYNLTI